MTLDGTRAMSIIFKRLLVDGSCDRHELVADTDEALLAESVGPVSTESLAELLEFGLLIDIGGSIRLSQRGRAFHDLASEKIRKINDGGLLDVSEEELMSVAEKSESVPG